AQQKLPTPPETKPAPTEPTPSLGTPTTPSEPTPAPSETMPPAEGGTPAPSESMPAPDSKKTPPETAPTVPDLPPLVPPGRQLPSGSPPKEHNRGEQKSEKSGALQQAALRESNLCQQPVPLGTITELNEPAKLEPQQVQPVREEVAI